MSTASPNTFFIVGEDDYLVDRAARNAIARFAPQGVPAGALDEIDGAAGKAETQLASIRAVRASIATPPFLDPLRVTWWRNVTFLPGAQKEKLSEQVKKALEDFAKELSAHPVPPNQALVITAPKVLAASVFAKAMKTAGETIALGGGGKPRERTAGAMSLLADEASAMGLKLSSATAAAIVAKRGTDSRALVSELAKIRDWMEPGVVEVPRAAVDEIVSPGSEPEVWELTDAISRRDAAAAVSTVRRLAGADSSGIMLASVLEKHFRTLVAARGMLDAGLVSRSGAWARGISAADAKRAAMLGFDVSKPAGFMQKRQIVAAAGLGARYLAGAHRLAAGLREKLVSSSSVDNMALLETAVLRLVAAAR